MNAQFPPGAAPDVARRSRRDFIRSATLATAAAWAAGPHRLAAQIAGDRPPSAPAGVAVLHPRDRVPVSLIIDDSTCLVNLAHFGIPQFAEVFPQNYRQDWRRLPREIPDRFVRQFGEWSQAHGVKGKYSIVPYPACVGWVDRELPGWTRRELLDSLELVRAVIMPNWDIHPEMITHTWALDLKTGRPYAERSERFMENWGFSAGKSVDELGDYFSYALTILKNAGLTAAGITTPGGFGNQVLPELSQATLQACRAVNQTPIPHYFRHLYDQGDRSVAPRVEYAGDLAGEHPRCVVSIIGCTGDWFGGWDGLERGSVDKLITADLKGGRLPEVIRRGEPAIMVCHWPGIYFNGEQVGFKILQAAVQRLETGFDNLVWMKLSEIARYAAARELTRMTLVDQDLLLQAPFACPDFTLRLDRRINVPPQINAAGQVLGLREVPDARRLSSGTWAREGNTFICCFPLPQGQTRLHWTS